MSVGEGDEERAEADLKEAVRWSGISVRVGRSVEDASACFSLLFSVQEINQSGIILAFEKTSGHSTIFWLVSCLQQKSFEAKQVTSSMFNSSKQKSNTIFQNHT